MSLEKKAIQESALPVLQKYQAANAPKEQAQNQHDRKFLNKEED